MITKKDILDIARHVVRRDQGIPDRQPMHPTREWVTGLVIASAVFVGGSVYAAFLFVHQFELFDRTVSVDTTVISYNQTLVKEVLETYRQKTVQFNALREKQGVPVEIAVPPPSVSTTTSDVDQTGSIVLD